MPKLQKKHDGRQTPIPARDDWVTETHNLKLIRKSRTNGWQTFNLWMTGSQHSKPRQDQCSKQSQWFGGLISKTNLNPNGRQGLVNRKTKKESVILTT